MTAARDEILARLQKQAHPQELPGPWPSSREFPDLADRFTQSLQSAHGELHHVPNLAAAAEICGAICHDAGARSVVLTGDTPLDPASLVKANPTIEWIRLEVHSPIKKLCAAADVGISGVLAAFAETGTAVLGSGPTRSRLATLLPPIHIALVPRSAIYVDLLTWIKERPRPLPANLTFVSGPSKTADIEQTMAIGVHGPRRFIIILIDQLS